MALQDGNRFAALCVPQPRRMVGRRGHHALAIGAERGIADLVVMPLEQKGLPALLIPVEQSQLRGWHIWALQARTIIREGSYLTELFIDQPEADRLAFAAFAVSVVQTHSARFSTKNGRRNALAK